ncbi:hypothetical protein HK102_007272 [Quaeritorhiza haematococci]|nr:hypothetical protein HK102_007272 [Quaeritorhiza haematococci]
MASPTSRSLNILRLFRSSPLDSTIKSITSLSFRSLFTAPRAFVTVPGTCSTTATSATQAVAHSSNVFGRKALVAACGTTVGVGLGFGQACWMGSSSIYCAESEGSTKQEDKADGVKPRPIVLSGPSGTGKSSLLKRLFHDFPEKFGFSVSHTTRKPRAGEEDGKDYFFVTREKMLEDIAAGKFIEHAEFSGNIYGTSFAAVQQVLDAGKNVILDIDMQGVKQLQSLLNNPSSTSSPPSFTVRPLFVFVSPPNLQELERRLRGRGTENEEAIQKRLATAKTEMEWGTKEGSVDNVIVNETLAKAYEELVKVIGLVGEGEDVEGKFGALSLSSS